MLFKAVQRFRKIRQLLSLWSGPILSVVTERDAALVAAVPLLPHRFTWKSVYWVLFHSLSWVVPIDRPDDWIGLHL